MMSCILHTPVKANSGGKQVLLADSIDDLILDILRGRTDAALLRSDAIPNLQRRGLVNASAFKFVDAVLSLPCLHGFYQQCKTRWRLPFA